MNGLPPEPAVFQQVEYLLVTFRTGDNTRSAM
jgi:hypothetical protein